jgi:hypothetical protein
VLAAPDTNNREFAPECKTVAGVPHSYGVMVVRCPFCGRCHRHGPGPGLRMAHCGDGFYDVRASDAR